MLCYVIVNNLLHEKRRGRAELEEHVVHEEEETGDGQWVEPHAIPVCTHTHREREHLMSLIHWITLL